MSRRSLTLVIAGIGVVVAAAIAALLPVPYVILSPGPTLNTLGRISSGPLIQVSGHPTYPTKGHLNLVTVSFVGGPGNGFNIFTALRGWLTPHDAVVPEQELFPAGQSAQQVVRQDTQQMTGSQQAATAAALSVLKIHYAAVDTISGTEKGMPAASVLRRGDVITAVDGTPVTSTADAGTLIRRHSPGSRLNLTILRGGKTEHVTVKTADVNGHSVVGVLVTESFRFPFNVKIRVGNIGGPSAGLMFALGIVDKLTPGDLTGGKFVAGTGEISPNGAVLPIGGIQQKLAGARSAGATIFLTPAQNCADAKGAVPAGMRLVKVTSLQGALKDLAAIRAGHGVPGC
ncbi:MAG TPA: PDZ domain-containing protein [Streptosporangiaceae bacterium]|jgi:PDZ domain-containing protein|nr:PDZ domain-containing protein [Streptosporangiaceae bacterium]